MEKLAAQEDTVSRLIFRTRSELDPLEVEYFRGFRQGVMYVLDGLPNTALQEYARQRAQLEETERGDQ